MKFFGQIIATIVLLTLAFGNLCLVQYLAWYGPQWMMHTGHGSVMLSFLVSGHMVAVSIALVLISIFGVWDINRK